MALEIPITKTSEEKDIFDYKFGKDLYRIATDPISKALIYNVTEDAVSPSLTNTGDSIQSTNFATGSAGWQIKSDGTAEFQSVTVAGVALTSQGTFGGDGTNGALSVTGTTDLDVGAARVFIRNYSSISITGTGALTFSNPHANGTLIILKSQGNVTLTSTATNLINASGMGADVATGGTYILDDSTHLGATAVGNTPGAAGVILGTKNFYTKAAFNLFTKTIFLACGSGGGNAAQAGGGGAGAYGGAGGAGSAAPASPGNNAGGNSAGGGGASGNAGGIPGAGGRGGAALLIECAGNLNFTGTITAAGNAGTNASGGAGGGGGGGAGGMIVILYNTQTATSGTMNTAGGAGGVGGSGHAGGTAGASDGGLVAQNTAFA